MGWSHLLHEYAGYSELVFPFMNHSGITLASDVVLALLSSIIRGGAAQLTLSMGFDIRHYPPSFIGTLHHSLAVKGAYDNSGMRKHKHAGQRSEVMDPRSRSTINYFGTSAADSHWTTDEGKFPFRRIARSEQVPEHDWNTKCPHTGKVCLRTRTTRHTSDVYHI